MLQRHGIAEQVNTTIDLTKAYVQQELVDPLRGAGRYMGFGLAASLLFGTGFVLLLIGILRVLQTETGDTFEGTWSFVPYLITMVVCAIVLALIVSRIKSTSLQHKERP